MTAAMYPAPVPSVTAGTTGIPAARAAAITVLRSAAVS